MGSILYNLSRLLGERRITQRKLSEISGLSLYTINKLYNEKWEGVGRKTLVKLCESLVFR
jgi:DNA-binding Xre family transcriptional regulator